MEDEEVYSDRKKEFVMHQTLLDGKQVKIGQIFKIGQTKGLKYKYGCYLDFFANTSEFKGLFEKLM